MESLLTLSIGDYHAVDLSLRCTALLVGATALLLLFSAACVGIRLRLPLFIASVALASSAWLQAGIAGAWRGAFELAGTSYCVTGLPLASEDRVLAWAFGFTGILLPLGMSQLDAKSKEFRILCISLLGLAIPGAIFQIVFLIGFVLCLIQLRGTLNSSCTVRKTANRLALGAMMVGVVLTELGSLHLLPLGKSADSILIHGELIRSFCDILTLVIPGLALLASIFSLEKKEGS